MSLANVISSPWAIDRHKYQDILCMYRRHLAHETLSEQAIADLIGSREVKRGPFEVVDGVAILQLEGVLAKKMNLFSDISGGTSTQLFGQHFQQAMDSPDVRAIILNVDSPGGAVDGTQALASMIFNARDKGKQIIAYTDGTMASAALWIGAAAHEIIIDGDTTQVGSIGVVATHTDISKAEEAAGFTTTEIVSSEFKRTPSSLGPLDEAGRDVLQSNVDHIHGVFVSDVAKFRGVDAASFNAQAGNGRVFLGTHAIAAGLVDRVQSFDSLLAELQTGTHEQRSTTMSKPTEQEPVGVIVKTVADMTASFPDLCKSMTATAAEEGFNRGLEEGTGKGALAERERIKAVEAQADGFPGHAALIQEMKYDGNTRPEEAAVKVLSAERSLKSRAVRDLHTDAPKPVEGAFTQEFMSESPAQTRDRLVDEYKAAHGNDLKAAYIAVSKTHPELFEAGV